MRVGVIGREEKRGREREKERKRLRLIKAGVQGWLELEYEDREGDLRKGRQSQAVRLFDTSAACALGH